MITAMLCLMLLQDPVEFTGPFEDLRNAIVERLEKRSDEQAEQMQGLLERWKEREGTDAARYHGLRGLLEEIRNRPQVDVEPLFPRLNAMLQELQAARKENLELRREIAPLKNIASIMWASFFLVVALVAFNIFNRLFPSKVA